MSRRTRAAVALGALLTTAVVAVPAPASAVPEPEPDRYRLYAGGVYTLTPLDNDDTSFLSSGELSLCGVSGVDDQRLQVQQAGDTLVVEALDTYRGTTTFSYQACQGDDARTSTVTLVVDRLADLRAAKKPRTRGKVLVTNSNAIPVRVTYGSATSGRSDATRTVPARGTITITTPRKVLYWLGLHDDAGVLVTVGDGVVEQVQKRLRRS